MPDVPFNWSKGRQHAMGIVGNMRWVRNINYLHIRSLGAAETDVVHTLIPTNVASAAVAAAIAGKMQRTRRASAKYIAEIFRRGGAKPFLIFSDRY